MPFQMFCYDCRIPLGPTAKRCHQCGTESGLEPGTVLQTPTDAYAITDKLGVSMAFAYTATDNAGLTVAVKQLLEDPDPAVHADNLNRFKREAEIQARIKSPRFPEGYGHFEINGLHFMAMQFISGRDLEKTQKQRQIPETEILEIGIQICEGIADMHDYVATNGALEVLLHRDIKPANVMQTPSRDIIILDLGIARAENQSLATQGRVTSIGTIEYCAPEQLMGNPVKQSDIYSTAASLYHLVVGQTLPPKYDDRAAAVDLIPANWQPVFRQALDNDFTRRQRSIHDFKRDLTQLLPAHLRPAAAAGGGAGPQTIAPTTGGVSIRWKQSGVGMINPGEYRQAIAGRAWQGTGPLAGAEITPYITDIAGANAGTQGQMVKTGQQGDFTLAIPDITVPVKVPRRFVEVVVVDQNTGAELYRETVKIKRPWNSTFVQVGAGAGKLMTSPLRLARWIGQQGGNAAGWVGNGLGNARQGIRNRAGQMINALRSANPAYSYGLLAAILFAIAVLTGVLENKMSFLGYIWPHALVISFVLGLGAFLVFVFRSRRFAFCTAGLLSTLWILFYAAYHIGK